MKIVNEDLFDTYSFYPKNYLVVEDIFKSDYECYVEEICVSLLRGRLSFID